MRTRTRPFRHPSRRGLSLVEVAVSVAAASVLVLAIGSVILVSSKALPDSTSVTRTALSAGAITDQMNDEVRYAIAVTEMSPASITFIVPDRDGDGSADSVRYAWSGGKLTRQVNGGAIVSVADNVKDFQLEYTKRKVTESKSTTSTVSSGEVLLATFSGWTSIVATTNQMLVTGSTWIAEAFTIDQVAIPPDATAVKISRVSLLVSKPSSGGADVTVEIHKPQTAGSTLPDATVVGSPAIIPLASLTTSAAWLDATFSDVVFPGPVTDLVLLAKGSGTTGGKLQYLTALLAPLDNKTMQWTSNSGSSWLPASGLNTNDLMFNVYGSYEKTTTATASTDTYYLTNVGVSIQVGDQPSSRIQMSARVLNEPGVPGP
jgi:hypothetical protein